MLNRVNAGGLAFTDAAGNEWEADNGYNSGNTFTSAAAIDGTLDDALYQTERFDPNASGADLEYSFTVPDGAYEVRLHFAETFTGITAPGMRVFDVEAEGSLALDNYDIFDHGGLNRAYVTTFPVTVADGELHLHFVRGVQNPKVCAIEIYAIQTGSALPTFEQWLESHGLAGQTDADSDGGTLSNLEEYELQMDPNDPSDDLEFSLRCADSGNNVMVSLPELKPLGNYFLHRSNSLSDLGNISNRIDTVTRAEVEAMTLFQRQNYSFVDTAGGSRGFYKLYFEPSD